MFFIAGFVAIYACLIAPWPGFEAGYSAYFRAIGNAVFSREGGRRFVHFEAVADASSSLDTRIILANRSRADAMGRVSLKRLRLDSRSVGWIPTALLLALVLGTPAPFPHRARSLVLGLMAVHGYVLLCLACYIWNQSTDLGLLDAGPALKLVLEGLEDTLIVQLGASFVAPCGIWLAVSCPWRQFIRPVGGIV